MRRHVYRLLVTVRQPSDEALCHPLLQCIVQDWHGITLGDEMGHNDHIDFALIERIEHFTESGELEPGTKEHGIALFVADNGIDALSPKQRTVWDKAIAPILARPMNAEERMQRATERDWEDEARYVSPEA